MDENDICHILYPLPRYNDLMAFSIIIQPSDLIHVLYSLPCYYSHLTFFSIRENSTHQKKYVEQTDI